MDREGLVGDVVVEAQPGNGNVIKLDCFQSQVAWERDQQSCSLELLEDRQSTSGGSPEGSKGPGRPSVC